ncbi:MAG: GNAT family N-acetyltransferase [Ilumatobacteraceae bacterium]
MAILIRTPTDDEWPAICRADGRAFGHHYSDEDIEIGRRIHDLSRFRVAVDDDNDDTIVSIAGSYAFDVTLPGGTTMPMGGVTWVSSAATHRRQGLMRAVVEAVHQDIDDRGEPVASLYSSEGGIYDRLGYGVATQVRVTSIETRRAQLRPEFATPSGEVRFADGDDVVGVMAEIWERFRRCRSGEIGRDDAFHDFLYDLRSKPQGPMTPAFYLFHRDGFAVYRMEEDWHDGHPQHTVHLIELVAITADAHLALWQTMLAMDLVSTIKTRALAADEPLPHLLTNSRLVRTTEVNDGVWVNVRDVGIAFGNRTYRIADKMIIEADGRRWSIDGGPDGASCKAVKSKPDLVTSAAGLGSLLYGGVAASSLVAGRRMTARNDDVLRRADIFFTTAATPHTQSFY